MRPNKPKGKLFKWHHAPGAIEGEARISILLRTKHNKRIFDQWLACHTQEEIGEREGITDQAVNQILQEMAELGGILI